MNVTAAIEGGKEVEQVVHLASLPLHAGKHRQQLVVHHLLSLVDRQQTVKKLSLRTNPPGKGVGCFGSFGGNLIFRKIIWWQPDFQEKAQGIPISQGDHSSLLAAA